MNVSVKGGGSVSPIIIPLLERLLDLLRLGALGSYESSCINRVVRWLNHIERDIDKQLIIDLRLIRVKSPIPWNHKITIGDAIKVLEQELFID